MPQEAGFGWWTPGRSGRRQWLGVGAGSRSVVGLSSSATCVFVFQASDREEVTYDTRQTYI